MKRKYLILITLLAGYDILSGQSVTFNYTGSIQTFTVPACVTTITIDARGGQGGGYIGGLGAGLVGTFTVTYGEVLNILVGEQGGNTFG